MSAPLPLILSLVGAAGAMAGWLYWWAAHPEPMRWEAAWEELAVPIGAPVIEVEALRVALAGAAPPVVVDVRPAAERAVSTLPGALSPDEYTARQDSLAGRPVVAYCTVGVRSGHWALSQELDPPVANLRGGILAWAHAGLPLTDAEGAETKRVHVYGARWNDAPPGYQGVW